jgi:predicted metal-binding membrane protein
VRTAPSAAPPVVSEEVCCLFCNYQRPKVPRAFLLPAAISALALAGWVSTALAMRSLDTAERIDSFLWPWVAMAAAMMLPTVVPAALLATAVGRSASALVSGYFTLWVASGICAFEAARGLAGAGKPLAAGAIVAAAAYELTPLKDRCLRRCRSPLGMLVRRRGFAAGIEHAVDCLGCCWALMLALLALGAGSMFWMAAVAAAIVVEKVTPVGARASAPVALALLGAAVWIVL